MFRSIFHQGDSAVMVAIKLDKKEILQALIKAKPDLNYKNPKGQDALMVAIEADHDAAVLALQKAGANLENTDNDGVSFFRLSHTASHRCNER